MPDVQGWPLPVDDAGWGCDHQPHMCAKKKCFHHCMEHGHKTIIIIIIIMHGGRSAAPTMPRRRLLFICSCYIMAKDTKITRESQHWIESDKKWSSHRVLVAVDSNAEKSHLWHSGSRQNAQGQELKAFILGQGLVVMNHHHHVSPHFTFKGAQQQSGAA